MTDELIRTLTLLSHPDAEIFSAPTPSRRDPTVAGTRRARRERFRRFGRAPPPPPPPPPPRGERRRRGRDLSTIRYDERIRAYQSYLGTFVRRYEGTKVVVLECCRSRIHLDVRVVVVGTSTVLSRGRRRLLSCHFLVFFFVVVRCVLYKRTSGWSSKASEAEFKGVEVCRD